MPTTTEGKAISACNSLKHGLRARTIVLPGESQDDWESFEYAYIEDLAPVGIAEETLALRAAELLWRMRRVATAERDAVLDRQQRPDEYTMEAWSSHSKFRLPSETPDILPETLPAPAALRPIMRYEAHLSRQFFQVTRELQLMQDRRTGARTTQITRVEIHGYPGKTAPGHTKLPNELQNDVAQPVSPVNHGSHGPPAVNSPIEPLASEAPTNSGARATPPAPSPAATKVPNEPSELGVDPTAERAELTPKQGHVTKYSNERDDDRRTKSPPLQFLERGPGGEVSGVQQRPPQPSKLPNELTSLLKFPPELRSLLLKSDPDTDDLDLMDPISEAEDEALEDMMRGYPIPRFKSP